MSQREYGVVVYNVPSSLTEDQLQNSLKSCGAIHSCVIIPGKKDSESQENFGYVAFAKKKEAKSAAHQELKIEGHALKLKFCKNVKKFKRKNDVSEKLRKVNVVRKKKKKARLIVRNLSFKVNEKELRDAFSEFGQLVDVKIPLKEDGRKRGFAFIQFDKNLSAIKAMNKLNSQELKGRPIAIDYALPKKKFENIRSSKELSEDGSDEETERELKVQNESELSEEDEGTDLVKTSAGTEDQHKQVDDFLKIFDADKESENEIESADDSSTASENSSDDEDTESSEEEDSESENEEKDEKKLITSNSEEKLHLNKNKNYSSDVNEKKTVFIRNIPFHATKEILQKALEEFGELEYCLLCIDSITEHPKGTAFVKFKNKEDAEKLIQRSASGNAAECIYLEGRKLYAVPAVSREELQIRSEEAKKKGKNNRNLHLVSEGLIRPGSEAAEGISQNDLTKRLKLETLKKQKLKNLHFFVSDKRLCVHNIPTSLHDHQFRSIFRKAAGPKAVVTEARIMRDLKNIDMKGEAKSKGFGFVAFTCHEHALQALRNVNNNPNIFTAQNRPIVEFSIESKLALLSKERRNERNRMKNKKTKQENMGDVQQSDIASGNKTSRLQVQDSVKGKLKNKKNKRKHSAIEAKPEKRSRKEQTVMEKKEKKNKKRKNVGSKCSKLDSGNFSQLVDHYKQKLLNKI